MEIFQFERRNSEDRGKGQRQAKIDTELGLELVIFQCCG